MSFGLMSAARFGVRAAHGSRAVELVELSIGMPSTTNSGCALPESDLMPRMRMYDEAPGSPDCELTEHVRRLARERVDDVRTRCDW